MKKDQPSFDDWSSVAPTGLEPVYPAWEAGILTARWKRQVSFEIWVGSGIRTHDIQNHNLSL